jgi:glycosyltransferase involved in cell wall biosynthesis
MRVLHVYSGNLFGGIETILLTIARHGAASASHEFALCFDERLARDLRTLGATVHLLCPVRASRPHTLRLARRRLAALLGERAFDTAVTHAPWSHALFAAVARRAGVPVAFWAHDAWRGRHWTERWARRVTPDLIVANSAFTLSTLREVLHGARRLVLHAPVDLHSSLRTNVDRAAVRAELSTAASGLVVVQASRMEAWKGHVTLLRALGAMRADPQWTAWIVGGAQRAAERAYEASLHRLAADLNIADRVRFVGERADVPRLLAAADICCQPNAAPEPFGVAFVEALAAGLPVVTSNIGGAADVVDESCGRLVAAGDVDGLRHTLASLMVDDDLRRRLADAGPARAAALCDPARQLGRLHDALSSIARVAVAG